MIIRLEVRSSDGVKSYVFGWVWRVRLTSAKVEVEANKLGNNKNGMKGKVDNEFVLIFI